MSYCFDQMSRWFRDRFMPRSGDKMEKELFASIIEEMHNVNHQLATPDGRFKGDALNKSQRVAEAIKIMEEYLSSKEDDLEIFLGTDQPEQCRSCGVRVEIVEEIDDRHQTVRCPACGYSYRLEWDREGDS